MAVYKRPNPLPRPEQPKKWVGRKCGECKNCTPETSHHTLSVHGRKPTMGRCPWYKDGKFCVLLSDRACEHFDE